MQEGGRDGAREDGRTGWEEDRSGCAEEVGRFHGGLARTGRGGGGCCGWHMLTHIFLILFLISISSLLEVQQQSF